MLFGTRVLPMVGLLATLAGWLLLPRLQPDRPQPTVSPSCGADAARHDGDQRPDGLPGMLAAAESPDSDWKG